ncbi:hypothetical protein PY650_24490 [Rhizobium calliandrae]|uniref:Uncharacterized protein n=1 Tax=Rhizobium calliandrae TaxID=1312182 RepID=A0ABT7KN92_9HYPH|nr:hypothetical protein [Rhizobium calliandrae]MDL2408743.1 hypothetical protein [Rhizobium calliandrae]
MTLDLKAAQAASDRYEQCQALIDRVEEGMLTPPEAQKEADRQGLGRLESFADKSRFPVAHEPVWSPVMAMAWMFWRDYDLVTDFYDPYRKSCLVWRTVPREQNVPGRPPLRPRPEQWYLGAMSPASLSGLKIAADRENRVGRFNHFPDFVKGKAEFFTALYSDKIAATGIRATTGEHERIESFRWAVLDFVEPGRPLANDAGSGGLRNFRFVEKHKPDEVYYSDVHLSRSDIEREWRAQMTEPVQPQETPSPPLSQRPAGKQQVRDAFHAASGFFKSRGLLMWSKDEAETDLPKLLNASRTNIREVFAEDDFKNLFSGGRGKRGPVNQNRTNELEEFRQFFTSANMRK